MGYPLAECQGLFERSSRLAVAVVKPVFERVTYYAFYSFYGVQTIARTVRMFMLFGSRQNTHTHTRTTKEGR